MEIAKASPGKYFSNESETSPQHKTFASFISAFRYTNYTPKKPIDRTRAIIRNMMPTDYRHTDNHLRVDIKIWQCLYSVSAPIRGGAPTQQITVYPLT